MIRSPIQDDLFGHSPKKLKRRKPTADETFRLWVIGHENVIELCMKFARQIRDAGKGRFGIDALTERVRWEVHFEKHLGDEYKISNSIRPRLARLLVQRDPSLAGLFEFKRLKEGEPTVPYPQGIK